MPKSVCAAAGNHSMHLHVTTSNNRWLNRCNLLPNCVAATVLSCVHRRSPRVATAAAALARHWQELGGLGAVPFAVPAPSSRHPKQPLPQPLAPASTQLEPSQAPHWHAAAAAAAAAAAPMPMPAARAATAPTLAPAGTSAGSGPGNSGVGAVQGFDMLDSRGSQSFQAQLGSAGAAEDHTRQAPMTCQAPGCQCYHSCVFVDRPVVDEVLSQL